MQKSHFDLNFAFSVEHRPEYTLQIIGEGLHSLQYPSSLNPNPPQTLLIRIGAKNTVQI